MIKGVIGKARLLRRFVALTIVAAAVAGTAAGSPGLNPPVIHEAFTLLPCPHPNAQSTLAIEGCQEHQIVKLDAKIDALAKLIFPKLYDAAARQRFVAGEGAWLAYRGAFCKSQSDIYEGGTASVLAYGSCVIGVNTQHVAALTAFDKAFNNH